MWAPPSHESPPPGWWHTLSYNRHVDRGRADRQAREEVNELGKRLRRARRRAERIDEALVLLASSDEARRHMRQQGYSYERANRHGYVGSDYGAVEHSPGGRILRVGGRSLVGV